MNNYDNDREWYSVKIISQHPNANLFICVLFRLKVLSCLKVDSDKYEFCEAYMEHIAKCYSSLQFAVLRKHFADPVFVPKRVLQYNYFSRQFYSQKQHFS